MKLGELFDIKENQNKEIVSVASHTDDVISDSVFFVMKGFNKDGKNFINKAIKKGAVVIVSNNEVERINDKGIIHLQYENIKNVYYEVVRKFYSNYYKVNLIGVTGTNGKTTTAFLIESIISRRNNCGLIGTIGYKKKSKDKLNKTKNTTQEISKNYHILDDMAKKNVLYSVLEVSSQGIQQERIKGLKFSYAVFTNLTQDHLDAHKTMENYFLEKKKLFMEYLKEGKSSIINYDDKYGKRLLEEIKGKTIAYGIKEDKEEDNKILDAYVVDKDIILTRTGMRFTINIFGKRILIKTTLIGKYNVYNILSAVVVCYLMKYSLSDIVEGVERVVNIPGRLQEIVKNVFIDYAHTPVSLELVIKELNKVKEQGRLIVVFGCGGNRDKEKRPLMGKVAFENADKIIITNDNPRYDDPKEIVQDIIQGIKGDNYQIILNREKAIRQAMMEAGEKDIILIAGKGHEEQQQIRDTFIDFDEERIVKKIYKIL